MAQHIWAAASHVLQYKQESNVPPPIRRSIYRVSAVLETVDLEFERVLDARDSYVTGLRDDDQEPLNVDSLANVLDEMLPTANKREPEAYAEVLVDLIDFGVDTTEKLKAIISKHLDDAIKADAERVKKEAGKKELPQSMRKRVNEGVFLSHVGLTRAILRHAFGLKYLRYMSGRRLEVRRKRAEAEGKAKGLRKPRKRATRKKVATKKR